MAATPTLYLIDASSIIHRAFHAISGLSTRDGQPTGAVFGFVRMLVRLLKDKEPERVAIVFDSKGPTFRHEIDPEYKANRPPMDPDLASQIPFIKEIVAAIGLKQIELPGFEADDIIATLAREAREAGQETVIVSGDKDLFQCLGQGVAMWDTMQDKIHDEASVKEKYGVGPDRLPDVFGLIGDSVDNIPGVPGIGPKTASQLISEYGDLETLLERAEEIKQPKRRQNLIDHADDARRSKRLFILDSHAPVEPDLETLEPVEKDASRLEEIFNQLEMASLAKEFASEPEAPIAPAEFKTIADPAELGAVVEKAQAAGRLALSAPTDDPRPVWGKLSGLGLCVDDQAAYLPGEGDGWLEPLQLLLSDPKAAKLGLNLKAAWVALKQAGVEMAGLGFDLMIADYLLYPGRRQPDLVQLAREHLGQSLDLSHPACEAEAVWRMAGVVSKKLKDAGLDKVFEEIEMPLLPVLARMEQCGVLVDREVLAALSEKFAGRLEKLNDEILAAAGQEFNPNSPQQLGFILFEKLGLPQQKKTRKKTGYSTDVEVLEELAPLHPLPGLILDFRQITKLKSTYVDALAGLIHPETGRIHARFNQTVTATGRLSSSEPNLQNIPIRSEEGRAIRRAFVPAQGRVLLSADYSQIELRFLAHYTKDDALCQAFAEGLDIHTHTAAKVFDVVPELVSEDMRRRAKAVNFGVIYGMTAYGLARALKTTPGTAAKFLEAYYKRYPAVKQFWEATINKAKKEGYVTTLWGRKRYLPDLTSRNQTKRRLAERMALNTTLQGSAADLIKIAMINLDQTLAEKKLPARLILQVHDELLLEVDAQAAEETAEVVKKVMVEAAQLAVPLEVGLGMGPNWDEAH